MNETKRSEAAAALFVNSGGELLLRLRDNKPQISFPNQWDLIGGKVEFGESVQEALRREVIEETGEATGVGRFFGSFDGAEALIHVFVLVLDKPHDQISLMEGQRVEFFTPEAAAKLPLVPWVREMLAMYMASNKDDRQ